MRHPEDLDGLLQALVRRREWGEFDAERVGEDLVAEAHGQQRPSGGASARDHGPHALHAGGTDRGGRPGRGRTPRGPRHPLFVAHVAPRRDRHVETEVAQLVGEHRGEAVLGIDDQRRASRERSVAGRSCGLSQNAASRALREAEQFGDRRVVGEASGSAVGASSSTADAASRRASRGTAPIAPRTPAALPWVSPTSP